MSLLNPSTWLLYGALAGALVLGAWRLDVSRQAIGYSKAQAEYTVAALAATEAARAREQQLQATVTKAQNDAQKRQKILAADAGRARAVADGLRDDLAAARGRIPALTRAAVNQYADTASIVFEQCVREYSEVARQADAIANDRQALIDAWPR